ncbi:conjugal transfer protein TrbC [Sphingomonas paucimobilis]|uniref:TrbC/VirB2 family protein n=1 Tax=Sphingomonas paucimobilis TaxID=13689 RepID=UPI000DE4AB60|nr:TrbC/VirB2 family protein [Sphingomonas paucimobilis]QBE92456.1 conjugal transfer protein TrbC [Sphingomonas paucimobilis]
MIPTPPRPDSALARARARWPDLADKALKSVTLGLALTIAAKAQASGSGMPWETPLQSILDSVQGPVAKIVGVIIIVITGLTLAFGDTSGGFRRLVQIVFGLSIAFAASSFFLSFFSFGGGALV